MKADMKLKNKAINELAPRIVQDETAYSDWTKDKNLLDFLNGFK
jgi:integrase/recombinase XerD